MAACRCDKRFDKLACVQWVAIGLRCLLFRAQAQAAIPGALSLLVNRYYKALYSQQIGALLGGGSSKNLPNMRNLAMELRKLCCHPVSLALSKQCQQAWPG